MSFRFRPLYLLVAGNILLILTVVFKFNRLPPQIPLFYSRPLGEDQLADTWMIILLPLLMNSLFFLNRFVYRRYFSENALIKNIVYYLNIFIIVSFSLIFVKIILLVT